MIVFDKAEDLINYTIDMTDDIDRFPKKRRFTFVNRMQNLALDIYAKLRKANGTRNRKIRRYLQSDAISDADILLFLVELSWRKNHINKHQCIVWTKKTKDVKRLAAAWYNKT